MAGLRPARQAAARLMQLTGDNLACSRGGREVFAGLNFSLSGGEALVVTGRNGAGKSSLLRMIAGLVRMSAGRLALERRRRRRQHRRTGALPRPPGRGETVAFGWRKPAILDAIIWAATPGRSSRRWRRSILRRSPACRPPICRPGNGGGCRSRGWSPCKRPLWLLDEPTSALDAPSQKRLAELMRGHLAGGGMIVAAAHGPIGLERARELKLGPT